MVLILPSVTGVSGSGSKDRPARTRAAAVFFFKLRMASFRLPPALSKLATPLPTASENLRVAPLVERATAVAAPVSTPVAMLCRFTVLRSDLPIAFVLFLFFIASLIRIKRSVPP